MKTIAFYLPQYHAIPENDEWWGKGFTEWTNVKKSKPLFDNHYQPEVPLNNDYYNLLDEEVQQRQSELALKYGVDGFCYYHYWFEGKLLLEKPMENMLKNSKVRIPFCVCWANESWARTWDGAETKILIKQNYSESESEWKSHFEYLLPFFKDERYIKDRNRPMLLLYKPALILNCAEMMEYWNKLAIENGFDGIFWGYQHPSGFLADLSKCPFDFAVEFEPAYTTLQIDKETNKLSKGQKIIYGVKHPKWLYKKIKRIILKLPRIYDYDEVWNRILARQPETPISMPGAFTAWDNTPRRGIDANVYYEATPEKFKKYIFERVKRAKEIYHAEYLFINAWNEWAEGAHLEPDEKNGYGYLEALKNAMGR